MEQAAVLVECGTAVKAVEVLVVPGVLIPQAVEEPVQVVTRRLGAMVHLVNLDAEMAEAAESRIAGLVVTVVRLAAAAVEVEPQLTAVLPREQAVTELEAR